MEMNGLIAESDDAGSPSILWKSNQYASRPNHPTTQQSSIGGVVLLRRMGAVRMGVKSRERQNEAKQLLSENSRVHNRHSGTESTDAWMHKSTEAHRHRDIEMQRYV